MKLRSQFLNHAVCDTMIAAAAAPTSSVRTISRTCVSRLTIRISLSPVPCPRFSERLPDREVHSPAAVVRLAVDHEVRNRIELIAVVEANRADWRHIAKAGSDRVAQIVQLPAERLRPHVAGVHEDHAAEVAVD